MLLTLLGPSPAGGSPVGSVSVTLDAATSSATASVANGLTATLAATLADATASGSASVANGPTATTTATLAAATVSATSTIANGPTGSTSRTLDAATVSSSATVATITNVGGYRSYVNWYYGGAGGFTGSAPSGAGRSGRHVVIGSGIY